MKKFESYRQINFIIAFIGLSILMGSCSSSTDPYQPFVGDEIIQYSQKPADVMALSGNKRVILKIVRPASPLVKKVGIFWNSGKDSLKADFPTDKDTLEVSVPGLDREGSYSFNIYTYNANGENRSVATTLSVAVYGDIYANSILTRTLSYLVKKPNGTEIHWESNPEGSIGTVLKYTNSDNVSDSMIVPSDVSKTSINLSEDEESLTYYSLYQPGASVDTFRAPLKTASIEGSSALVIYDDSPQEGWSVSADDGLIFDTMNGEPVYSGEFSTMINFGARFNFFFLNAPQTIDVTKYSRLKFSVYAEESYVEGGLRFVFRNNTSGYGDYRHEIQIDTYNEWKTYTISISEIGTPTEITQFGVQSHSGDGTVYIDEIVLLR